MERSVCTERCSPFSNSVHEGKEGERCEGCVYWRWEGCVTEDQCSVWCREKGIWRMERMEKKILEGEERSRVRGKSVVFFEWSSVWAENSPKRRR
ncbi:hypothetical protein COLO4_36805 [Corchorus olitorius]|uniref:Uncharacterized protein n=1 Tax=Corchorus olitorius TaxID=93759 RepID=A0A1R3G554_9ROSI|nr:hypothetical protein COLO4_36805 [Corchorus olitorius]